MARAPFNTTFSTFAGPASPSHPPGTPLQVDVPCRVVPQDEIFPQLFPFNHTTAWVTYVGLPISPPNQVNTAPGVLESDYGGCDRVTIASYPGAMFVGVWEEFVAPGAGATYRRFRIILLPLPF